MVNSKHRASALVLLSGGLDSILAIKILQKQDVDVTGLTFVSYFFNANAGKKAVEQLGAKHKIIDFADEHLKMTKDPAYGYGKAMNPCIDCHLLMIKKAGQIMKDEGFDFVATGEVLGERPMSQNKSALDLIEKEAGLKGYLLRPLSAKLLEPTIAEEKGLINRDDLFNISGRGRKKQMALAKEWGIKKYPTPAGGCLLTDQQFGTRLKELLDQLPNAKGNDMLLSKLGRHFWVDDNRIIIGRNEGENHEIKKLIQKGDVLIEPKKFAGPTILIRGNKDISEQALKRAKELMIKYSPKLRKQLEQEV